ncbi:MAG: DNA-processing protein DprA [Pseudohongiella sp.]|uniref:DNA-processing protein DprA n=1 Tax=Pseudohongiella sp. TaxID=1979412 RepID=UPI0034A0AC0E
MNTDRMQTKNVSEWLDEPDHHLVTVDDPGYPPLLRETAGHPLYLYVRGDPDVLTRPMIAIVGSRNSTAYGRETAFRLGAELAKKGFVVCSGLAAGIDTEAHKAAVKAGVPTVAVLGNGLHDVYPATNRGLARHIAAPGPAQGALISELALDAGPIASHFPSRNRIISGLSLGVCVVEATMRSGSLITARLALQQNREVFAVPGSVNSSRSRGCHELLRQGAVLVETADDILAHVESLYRGQLDLLSQLQPAADVVAAATGGAQQTDSHSDAGENPDKSLYESPVLACIGTDPINMDALVQRTGLTVSELSRQLLALELAGRIHKHGGSWVRQSTCK